MSDKREEPETEELDEMELGDLGEPITELQTLVSPVPEGFIGKIQSSIRRRELAADLTRFSLWAPALVFMEYIAALFGAFGSSTTSESDSEENE